MLFAADVLAREPGATVIYDVKSTRNLKPWIARHGGTPLLWKTGHSLIKGKMKETGARARRRDERAHVLRERWYGFDDGLYAGARLLEILSRHADASAVLDALPDAVSTPELHVPLRRRRAPRAHRQARRRAPISRARPTSIRIDGLRVEYPDGFGLARASNTTPMIVLRFEADDAAALDRIKGEFRRVLGRREARHRAADLSADASRSPTSRPPATASPAASTYRPASSRSRCRNSPARMSSASSTTCSAPAASRSAAPATRC